MAASRFESKGPNAAAKFLAEEFPNPAIQRLVQWTLALRGTNRLEWEAPAPAPAPAPTPMQDQIQPWSEKPSAVAQQRRQAMREKGGTSGRTDEAANAAADAAAEAYIE